MEIAIGHDIHRCIKKLFAQLLCVLTVSFIWFNVRLFIFTEDDLI